MKNKKIKEGYNTIPDRDEARQEGSAKAIFVGFIIAFLFLMILIIMIKMNVGGFGRDVLRPILKDVPGVNKILPEPTDEEIAKESGYSDLAQAVAKIEELENQIKQLEAQEAKGATDTQNEDYLKQIEELKEQIKQLKIYEENQKNFAATKEAFYKEVVSNDKVETSDYIKWYESMDADTAAKLYKEAVVEQEATEEQKVLAESYANMKPEKAADILEQMTGDMDTVVAILNEMSAEDRGKIMESMEPSFAAKITKKIVS